MASAAEEDIHGEGDEQQEEEEDEEEEAPEPVSKWDTPEKVSALRTELTKRAKERGLTLHVLFTEENVCKRYLRARRGNLKKAAKMLLDTHEWRFSMTPHWPLRGATITEALKDRARVGVAQVRGYDKLGRPCVLMRPRLHDPSLNREMLTQSIVFTLDELVARCERAPHFATQFVCIFDLKDLSRANVDMDFVKQEITFAANHFPERLGAAYLVNPGWLFWLLYKVISQFIDKRTRDKIHMCKADGRKELLEAFDPSQLPECLGGTLPNEMDTAAIFTADAAKSAYVSLREGPLPPTLQRAWAAASPPVVAVASTASTAAAAAASSASATTSAAVSAGHHHHGHHGHGHHGGHSHGPR